MVNGSHSIPLHAPASLVPASVTGKFHQNPAQNTKQPEVTAGADSKPSREGDRNRTVLSLKLLLVSSVLCCLGITLYGLAGFFGDSISRGGHSSSKQQLEMVVANSVLNVPENMIRFSAQRRAGTHQKLELYMHWPSLAGYEDLNKEFFNSANKHESLIFLSIEPRSMSLDMSGRIGPIYSKFFNGVPTKGVAGLMQQPLKPEGGFIDEDLHYESGSPYPFATRCVRQGSTIATPFCIRDIHIGNDLMLTYRFHVRHLKDWISIDGNIRKYVNSLLLNRPTAG